MNASLQCFLLKKVFQLEVKCFFLLALKQVPACAKELSPLLVCPPLTPLQIVLHREQEVLDCECDMASVHHLLSQIPQDLPYESLISKAGDLFVQFPPSELTKEAAQAAQAER